MSECPGVWSAPGELSLAGGTQSCLRREKMGWKERGGEKKGRREKKTPLPQGIAHSLSNRRTLPPRSSRGDRCKRCCLRPAAGSGCRILAVLTFKVQRKPAPGQLFLQPETQAPRIGGALVYFGLSFAEPRGTQFSPSSDLRASVRSVCSQENSRRPKWP